MSNMTYRYYDLYLDKFIYSICQQTKLIETKHLEPNRLDDTCLHFVHQKLPQELSSLAPIFVLVPLQM